MGCSGMRLSFENNSIGLIRIPTYENWKTTNLEDLINVTISQVITALQSFERFGLLMSYSLCSNYELAKIYSDVVQFFSCIALMIVSASLVARMVKNLPAMQETWVTSLGQEDPLDKEMATHSSILTWRIPRTEVSGRLQSMESQRVRHNWVTNTFTSLSMIVNSQIYEQGPNSEFLHSLDFLERTYHLEFWFRNSTKSLPNYALSPSLSPHSLPAPLFLHDKLLINFSLRPVSSSNPHVSICCSFYRGHGSLDALSVIYMTLGHSAHSLLESWRLI